MNPLTNSRCKIILFVLALLLIWQSIKFLPELHVLQRSTSESSSGSVVPFKPVQVSVYYEALCPDSRSFFVKHLLPTVNKAPALVNVTLVPYGKAKTDKRAGSFLFSCQHGPNECDANKIHACAVSKITEPILLIKYITCMISDNMVPELIGQQCASEFSVDWSQILECANSIMGSTLLSEYGQMTDSLNPKMTFVPTVLLNQKYGNQAAILKDFFKEICAALNDKPNECN